MASNQLSGDLTRQYQTIISLPEKAFFVGLANYVRSVLDNPDLDSIRAELSQKALSDYDKTIEVVNEKDSIGDSKKDWKMADFVKAGSDLARKLNAIKDVSIKEQTETSHAWMKLQTLEMFVHDRKKAKNIYSKTPRGLQEYDQTITELNLILSTKANERDSEEYEFWVESGRKENMQAIPRSIFVQDEYQNYLSQVHLYLLSALSNKNVSSTIIFPEGETVLYRKGTLYFFLSDVTHDFIDFSTSPKIRMVFEVFWANWKRTHENTVSDSKVFTLYRELHGEDINKDTFADYVSHIRTTKINKKPHLKSRIGIYFDRKTKLWNYHWE